MSKRHRPGISAGSVLRHVDEIVLATSGADAFELVFAVAAARAFGSHAPIRVAIAEVAARHPTLGIEVSKDMGDDLLAHASELLSSTASDRNVLDAIFENLVPRVAKSDKGQFFTPRHVVAHVVALLAPKPNEVLVDPACGSGAFLAEARDAGAKTYGCDVDLRAVRVARLLALTQGTSPDTIRRGDGLRGTELPLADIVATNPPFAGRADAQGFEVADLVRSPERDILFLERSLDLLRPLGRLGIVLPYGKSSGEAYAELRRWLVRRARVFAVVSLPRETFLPHTSQRTVIVFAQKRSPSAAPPGPEKTLFVVSERAGKDASGEPILNGDRLDHDLDDAAVVLRSFFQAEGFV